jgi:predicted ribosomally synthesized peptide with SipW-like signal peptide
MNKKILISLSVIGAVAAIAVGGTIAYFSDTETSTGNTFTAGSLDLKVDNTCYYNKLADGQPNCPMIQDNNGGIVTTWASTDLGVSHKFFYFDDVKPGDYGEDTISLTVDNDACLKLDIANLVNNDNTCTEPESADDPDGVTCGTTGELQENVLFTMWLDQGVTPGFQGPQDLSECDNDYIAQFEPVIISEGPIDPQGETWDLNAYGGAYLLADQKACFGVSWRVPSTVGNEIQSDSLVGDMIFNVIQKRHNVACEWPVE